MYYGNFPILERFTCIYFVNYSLFLNLSPLYQRFFAICLMLCLCTFVHVHVCVSTLHLLHFVQYMYTV